MSSKKQRTDSASDETGNGGALATLKDGVIRYSQVWEDDALLIAGLEVAPDDNILAIASAGDNVLNMLLAEPKEIVAVDVNPAQTALCELKMAAIKQLDHADFLTLIGYTSCEDVAQKRRDLCASLELSPELRDYWVHNDEMLTKGIASAGRLVSACPAAPLHHTVAQACGVLSLPSPPVASPRVTHPIAATLHRSLTSVGSPRSSPASASPRTA
jgi:S-adenosylmethionine:diacylglycerol 3-amino-3-carboxypropyl transferase